MASSGTYAYAPDNLELVEEAFERALIDPATLVARHWTAAARSMNLLFVEWATRGVKHFAIDEQTQTLTDGTASYTAASGTLAILEAVIRRDGKDTPVYPMTRDEYVAIPDKTAESLPTRFWLDRQTGTYYLWQVPENSTDVLRYRRARRIQDAGTGLNTPDVGYLWLEALASGLAARLAEKFAPAREADLRAKANAAFLMAKSEDRERADTGFGLEGV